MNIEVYHPDEPVDLEISYGKSKHRWYVPYGVSLIEGDVKYLMLAHEKLKPANAEDEKMFDFVLKAVPSSLTSEVVAPPNHRDDFDDDDDESRSALACKSVTRQSRAFATVSAETRQIDTIERKRQINPDAHVLCFSFLFVYDSESFDLERLSVPIEMVYVTNECDDSTVKLKCNHKCMCSLCYESYIRNTRKCPMCRQLF